MKSNDEVTLASLESSKLDSQTISSILEGRHDDLFKILGIHSTALTQQKVIRTFLPGALSVTVVSASGKTKLSNLTQIGHQGLFEGFIDRKTFSPYKLLVQYPLDSLLLDDPYRFEPQLSSFDLYLFNRGKHQHAQNFLGARQHEIDDVTGVLFSVWAPSARKVSVVGDFNHWDGRVHVMRKHHDCGVWEIFIPGNLSYAKYKFQIIDSTGKQLPLKIDPYARYMELRPGTASTVVSEEIYAWQDQEWMQVRGEKHRNTQPMSIYEVHLGSWRRSVETNRFLTYQELAEQLIPYVKDMGFSHVQLMPISEFPFDGSWGYQPLGMFAPTSRFGDPNGLKRFIDLAHQKGLGVLLDWVPGHFPNDEHGLANFDGTHLYEYADPRKGFHPDWNTFIYDYSRPEVISFLTSSALYWLSEFHFDGLRFDAVASMLYLDYSRKDGEWIPNEHGGNENLEAIALLRRINESAYHQHPDILMIAEESTAWPGVTHFTDQGGLGFGFKWNLGWMNDSLSYMQRDPVHRRYHQNELTFSLLYAYDENFILPLSHDEVVHGKRSLLEKMPGDDWKKFANLRAYLAFMWCHPGKKLMFMGDEIAQRREWDHDTSLDWHLLEHSNHRGIQHLVRDLNTLYFSESALFSLDPSPEGFNWIDVDNHADSVFIFARHDELRQSSLIVAVNMTPSPRHDYRIGAPHPGVYSECLNTDSHLYGGSDLGNLGEVEAEQIHSHGCDWSLNITLPPLAAVIFKR